MTIRLHHDKVKENYNSQFCKECGTENHDLKFCKECGIDLHKFKLPCTNCNWKQYYKYKFCEVCGFDMSTLQRICVNCFGIQMSEHDNVLCMICGDLVCYVKKDISISRIIAFIIMVICNLVLIIVIAEWLHLSNNSIYVICSIVYIIYMFYYLIKWLQYDEAYQKELLIQTKKYSII